MASPPNIIYGAITPIKAGAVLLDDSEWEDLRFPSQGINPPGAASDPTTSTTTGILMFSGTADNIIGGVAQFPHSRKGYTYIVPHIHLVFPTSASENSRWKFEYDYANVNEDFVNTHGTYTDGGTITVANPQNAKKHVIANFNQLAMSTAKGSCCILWRISRLASSDALDNHTSDIAFLEFDIHYQVDKLGSENIIPTS